MTEEPDTTTETEQLPPTPEGMEGQMRYFFTKMFAASMILFGILAVIYAGVDSTLKGHIVEAYKSSNISTAEPYPWSGKQFKNEEAEQNGEEWDLFFWTKFRTIIIQCQLVAFVLSWIVVAVVSLATLSMFSLNVSVSKLISVVGITYTAIVLPIFLLLAYTDIFGKVFENTIGYFWVNMGTSLNDTMNGILTIRNQSLQILSELPYSFSFLITMMDMANFCESIEILKGTHRGTIDPTNDATLDFFIRNIAGGGPSEISEADFKKLCEVLLNKVVSKHVVGEFIWVYFGAVVTMFISLSSLL